jgi:glycosyltransferase involved in cell wall biosynthesis
VRNLDASTSGLYQIVQDAVASQIEVLIVVNQRDLETRKKIYEICAGYSSHNLKIISSEIESPGGARNLGLENSRTSLVTFWDADDRPVISNVCKLAEKVQRDPQIKFGVGSFQVFHGPTGKILENYFIANDKKFESDLVRNPGIWRWIFVKERIGNTRFQMFRMGEDQDFLADLNPSMHEIIHSSEVNYLYAKGWDNQLTGSKVAIDSILESIKYLISKMRNDDGNSWHKKFLIRQILTGVKRGSYGVKFLVIFQALRLARYYVR